MTVRRELRGADKYLRLPKPALLRKRLHEIPAEERSRFESRMEELPLFAEAHKLREEFFNIWNLMDRGKAEERMVIIYLTQCASRQLNDTSANLTNVR